MIESIHFKNFKVLRDATLPLGRFTLIVGPNGSGKSTALEALTWLCAPGSGSIERIASHGCDLTEGKTIDVSLHWGGSYAGYAVLSTLGQGGGKGPDVIQPPNVIPLDDPLRAAIQEKINSIRVYSLDANLIGRNFQVVPNPQLEPNGSNLAIVLDELASTEHERFEALNAEYTRWLPEFDRIQLVTIDRGQKCLALRTCGGGYEVRAWDVSQGQLLALAMLTLAHIPSPPHVIGFEEPDRGIHPRLLRDVRDALYRLAYPEQYGETREPVQVIATTHSPYFLDLFKDHPEEIVIAQKVGQDAKFERLSDREDIDEILQDANLGEVWYTGILGGVPSDT